MRHGEVGRSLALPELDSLPLESRQSCGKLNGGMDIVLDSTAFCEDYRTTGANFRLLLENLPKIPAHLKIPEVVIDEVVNRFREELSVAAENMRRAQSGMSRLLGKQAPSTDKCNSAVEAARYRQELLDRLGSFKTMILPYPMVPHKSVVEHDLSRRRPFKITGAGYRDFLIWKSICPLILWGGEQVAFVTNNVHDFGEGPLVHEDLQKDLSNPRHLKLYRTVKELNSELVMPRLTMWSQVQATTESDFDFASWLRNNLRDLVPDEAVTSAVLGFPAEAGSAYAREVVRFQSVQVKEARELDSGKKFVSLVLSADIQFSADVGWDDYQKYPEVREVVGQTERFSSNSWYPVDAVRLTIDMILSPDGKHMEAADLVELDGPHCAVSFARTLDT